MKNKALKIILFLLLVGLAPITFADSFGEVSENLMGPLTFLTRLVEAGTYVLGAVMFMFAFIKVKAHRDNPKLVPLSIPIIFFICGGFLLLLPYLTNVFGDSYNVAKEEGETYEEEVDPNQLPHIPGVDLPSESTLRHAKPQPADPYADANDEDFQDPYSEY